MAFKFLRDFVVVLMQVHCLVIICKKNLVPCIVSMCAVHVATCSLPQDVLFLFRDPSSIFEFFVEIACPKENEGMML